MDFNFTDTEILIFGGVVAFAFFIKLLSGSNKGEEGARIKDDKVTMKSVLDAINEFTVVRNPSLKVGYTEKSIQKQLNKHLLERFEHVTMEYGIEGLNATKIDFDIGHGAVGLELKLANQVFKEAAQDRLVGQIIKYTKRKYKDENFLVAVFGEKEHMQDRAMLRQIKERIEEEAEAEFVFVKIPKDKSKVEVDVEPGEEMREGRSLD